MDLDSALTDKPADGATATEILRADHREVARLFAEYERVRSDAHARGVVAQTLCMQLELHSALEQDVFYPAARACDPDRVAHASEVHDAMVTAVRKLQSRADADEPLDEAVAELRSLFDPHATEEEQRLFPRLEEQSQSWLRELGAKLIGRKEALTRSTGSFEAPAT